MKNKKKNSRHETPYINNELKELIKTKNKLKKKYAKHPLTYGQAYKSIRNKVTSILRKSKFEYGLVV